MGDDEAMALALAEANLARQHDDVPVGAVALRDGVVVASAHNERELTGDPSFGVPRFMLERLLRRDSNEMIGRLRREIAARASEATGR